MPLPLIVSCSSPEWFFQALQTALTVAIGVASFGALKHVTANAHRFPTIYFSVQFVIAQSLPATLCDYLSRNILQFVTSSAVDARRLGLQYNTV